MSEDSILDCFLYCLDFLGDSMEAFNSFHVFFTSEVFLAGMSIGDLLTNLPPLFAWKLGVPDKWDNLSIYGYPPPPPHLIYILQVLFH